MRIYNHGVEVSEEEVLKVIERQIGLVLAKEAYESVGHDDEPEWEDMTDEERIKAGSKALLVLFMVWGRMRLGAFEKEDGSLESGWYLYPSHFGLYLKFEEGIPFNGRR